MKRTKSDAPACPGTLKSGFITYSPSVIRNLFDGKSVFHILNESDIDAFPKNAIQIESENGSVAGIRMQLVKNKLTPGVNGNYLLKTVHKSNYGNLNFHFEQPANEHLCMQIAEQVFDMDTLGNAIIFFSDGTPAIIYKLVEQSKEFTSFETLHSDMGKFLTIKNCIEIIEIIEHYCAASHLVKDRFFQQVLFIWLMSNSSAHVKNAGLIKTNMGDWILAPLSEIYNNKLHDSSDEFAQTFGLYENDKKTIEFRENGRYTRNEFTSFGLRAGIPLRRIEKIFKNVIEKKEPTINLVDKAFLPEKVKDIFKKCYVEKIELLK